MSQGRSRQEWDSSLSENSMKKAFALVVAVLAADALIAQGPPQPPTPAVLQNYPAITVEQLKAPPDGDWPMVRRTYDGWGYSPYGRWRRA